MRIECDHEAMEIIFELCDAALRHRGLAILPKVQKIAQTVQQSADVNIPFPVQVGDGNAVPNQEKTSVDAGQGPATG